MWLPPEIKRFGCVLKYELAEYADRLIEPKLLRKAVVIHGTGEPDTFFTQLAVPVGGCRRSGHVVATTKTQAKKIARALTQQAGYPNPRVVVSEYYSPDPGVTDFWEVEWGDRIPSGTSGDFSIMRGVYYGYSDQAIVNFIVPQRRYVRKRRVVLESIRAARQEPNATRCLACGGPNHEDCGCPEHREILDRSLKHLGKDGDPTL
jgi:hypothetical protein